MSDDAFNWVGNLYELVRPRLLAYLAKKRVDRVTAEDMVQECFVVFRTNLLGGEFRDVNAENWLTDDKYRPMVLWLYRAAQNTLLNHRRKRRPQLLPDGMNWDNLVAAGDEARFTVKEITDALGRCEEKHRLLLVRRYPDGLSIRQLADEFDTNEGTVKSRLATARAAMKKQLLGGKDFDESG